MERGLLQYTGILNDIGIIINTHMCIIIYYLTSIAFRCIISKNLTKYFYTNGELKWILMENIWLMG